MKVVGSGVGSRITLLRRSAVEKNLEPLIVRTTNDGVEIVQDYQTGDRESVIFVRPEELDILIAWLQEAKSELEKKE
jgi:hypothetical protein